MCQELGKRNLPRSREHCCVGKREKHLERLIKIPKVEARSSIIIRAHSNVHLVPARTPSSWFQA